MVKITTSIILFFLLSCALFSMINSTAKAEIITLASTELINFGSLSPYQINTWIGLMEDQNITLFVMRINAMYFTTQNPTSQINVIKDVITTANAHDIAVAVDLHTWTTTWNTYFQDGRSPSYRTSYIAYVNNVISQFESDNTNVHSFMVLNEPNAWPASSEESGFILDVIAEAHSVTDRPVSVRFQGGDSPSTGHYSSSINTAVDFVCANTYWDARNPNREVSGCSQQDLLDTRDDAHAMGKQFWITEFGAHKTNEENQRSHVEAFVEWSRDHDIDAIFCWVSQPTYDTENYNIFDGWDPRPAFYELVNPTQAPPPDVPPNDMQLVYPFHLQTKYTYTVMFFYYPVFYQSIINASLWCNVSDTWQPVESTTVVLNNTVNNISHTFVSAATYIWNIQVFNSTDAHWAAANRTLIIDLSVEDTSPPFCSNYYITTTTIGQTAILHCHWTDDFYVSCGLHSYNINGGGWINSTVQSLFAPETNYDASFTLSWSVGTTVGIIFYANDTSDNWNQTTADYFTITPIWTVSSAWTPGSAWTIMSGTGTGDNAPQYGSIAISSTVAGSSATFQCALTDDNGLGFGLLSHNASSGVWQNRTALSLSGTSDTFADSFTLPSAEGTVVGYRFYGNDSAGQWNVTSILTLTTTAASPGGSSASQLSLTVTVIDSNGSAVYQAKVTVYSMRMFVVSSGLTDRRGEAGFSLSKGEYLVEASKGLLSGSRFVNLVGNTEVTVSLGEEADWWTRLTKPLEVLVEPVREGGGVALGWVWNNFLIVGFGVVGCVVAVYGSREDDERVVAVGGGLLAFAFTIAVVGYVFL